MRNAAIFLLQILIAGSSFAQVWRPLPAPIFDQHYQWIATTPGEGRQLDMALDLLSQTCVTTLQVGDLMYLLRHDGRRLELALFAYASVSDPQNFLWLADLIHHPGRREEFYRFAKAQRPVYRSGPPHAPAWGYRSQGRDWNRRDRRDRFNDWDDDRWDRDNWDDWEDDRRDRDGHPGRGRGRR